MTITLEHVGFGSAQFILDRVLNSATFVSSNNFIGNTYRFTSDATTTIQDIADMNRFIDIPPGDYIPTLPDDATDSEMSSFWNGQDVNGTWRLFISDTDGVSGGSNATWTWRLDIATLADTDNDGVPDNEDECPNSDRSATVVIDGCNSGVTNTLSPSGCTIADLVAECAGGASNHGQFVSCVDILTDDMKTAGSITGKQKGAIQRCAAKADIP